MEYTADLNGDGQNDTIEYSGGIGMPTDNSDGKFGRITITFNSK